MRILWVSIVGLGLLSGLMAGCGADTASGSAGDGPAPATDPAGGPADAEPDLPPTASLPPALPPGHVQVHGIVFKATGDPPVPDRPYDRGTIVAIPRDRYETFQLKATGPWKGRVVQGSDFPLPPDLLAEETTHACDLKADGTYSLVIPPGRYALCIGNFAGARASETADEGVWVDKWIEATVTDEEFQTIILIFNRRLGEVTVLN